MSVQQAIRSIADADQWLDVIERPLECKEEIEEIMSELPIAIPPPLLWFGAGDDGHGHPGQPIDYGVDFPARVTGFSYADHRKQEW